MANLQSLGLHEPSALGYLVSEGLLTPDPSPSSYKWDYQQSQEGLETVTDEILRISGCVVWSRNGAVKRVFNLNIEGETINHAFTTTFESRHTSNPVVPDTSARLRHTNTAALIVVLKTQVHVFLLSGDTHVIPLSFEVEKAIPAAYGFLLQRQLIDVQTDTTDIHSKNTLTDIGLPSPTPSAPGDTQHRGGVSLFVRGITARKVSSQLPRTFAFPQLLSELSLVVSGSLRKQDTSNGTNVLSSDEEILYVSTSDELHDLQISDSESVYLAVTINPRSRNLTLWQVLFHLSDPARTYRKETSNRIGSTSKRKSSNVYGRQTGATTPNVRGAGTFRESIGGLNQPIPESGIFAPGHDRAPPRTGDLAAQLGHEFEQIGVQTRSARRVSSMLARTDLGGANDRSAFNEMATGSLGRKSFGRSMRRGESLGGFSDRQSFGVRRRSSFQAASSIYSEGTSFLDIPASHLLDDGTQYGQDSLDTPNATTSTSRLPQDVSFMKLKSLPYPRAGEGNKSSSSIKIITMVAPDRSTADDRRSRIVSVCIMDSIKQEMTIVNVAAKVSLSANRHKAANLVYDLKAVEVQRGQSIVDACVVADSYIKRLLILTHTRDGQSVLHLEAPWSVSYRINLPARFKVFDKASANRSGSPASRRDTGIRRSIPDAEIDINGLQNCESIDQVIASDSQNRYHRLRLQLLPSQPLICRILRLCNFVLAPEFVDSLLVVWWEVKRWIETQGSDLDIEWTATTVTLFVLAVPFISSLQSKPAQGVRKKKGGLLRSSSGTTVDLSNWDAMQEMEASSTQQSCTETSPWTWTNTTVRPKLEPKSPSKHARGPSTDALDDSKLNPFLIRCTNLARDFLQSPAGESATGPEGYLPIAVNKDRTVRRTALASILVGLHLLREEFKLSEVNSSLPKESSENLAVVIVQLASWLKWKDWCMDPNQYYYLEVTEPNRWLIESSIIDNPDIPAQPFQPPSIFQHIESLLVGSQGTTFPSLLDLLPHSKPVSQNHPLWKEAVTITPRLFMVTSFMSQHRQGKKARSIVKQMVKCGIDNNIMETLPSGIAAVCYQAVITVRGLSQPEWSNDIKMLVGRTDLDTDQKSSESRSAPSHVSHGHDSLHDYHTICNSALDTDSVSRWDASSELDRQAITRLIFHEDRRFQEASKLVNQTRPPIVECTPEPGWSEADFLEAQKELAVQVTRRTLSVAAGRAMMHFNARVPLLTERVPIPAFSLQCVMRSQGTSDDSQPMTLSADKALFTEDKVCWAFFHNGASAGLMISRETRWVDTSWILYNKPPELTNRHAGFLLALGLNGHLKSLAKWVAFKYLTPKHTMTSVGLLLGLAASYIGTMDTLIARLLSVHVTRLLPVGAAELNLSPLTQTTGIIGVGLLYCFSQHRRMSEIMLSEIENNDAEERSGEEPILRDEGYRLAAGFSLGLINLGQGKNLHSLHDMGVTERLLNIAIGTKNVNMVHVLDRATAGAVIAVAFIFLKTNDETIAQKIDIPDTMHQFDYVRPDIFLLRTLARHLIMWDSMTPTQDFVRASLPPIFRKRAQLSTTRRLSTDDLPFFNVIAGICFAMSLRFAGSHQLKARDLLVYYLDQFLRLSKLPALNYDAKVTLNGVRNCLDVLALSCATVMAGSGDITVMRRLRALHGRTDKETPFGSHLAAHMALGVLFLSGGTATFGTSDLAIAALVISLYPLFPVDVLDNKAHLQALRHLWVLAVENRCLIARDIETQQIISDIEAEVELTDGTNHNLKSPGLLPAFDSTKKVSFRHGSYWPISVDFDSPSKQTSNSISHQDINRKAPLSTREYLKSRRTGLQVNLQRRVAYEKPDIDTFFSELQALDEARGIPSVDVNAGLNEKWRQLHSHGATSEQVLSANPFDWVFELDSLKRLGSAEKALVMDDNGLTDGNGKDLLGQSAVDTMLEFEFGCLGVEDSSNLDNNVNGQPRRKLLPGTTTNKDRLWQLRLLFAWVDRWEAEDEAAAADEAGSADVGEVRWMKQEVIEQLRWRVWNMAGGQDE